MSFPPGANTDGQGQAFLMGNPEVWEMPAPASYSGATTYLATDIIGGIIVNGGTANGSFSSTLPTAALLVAAMKAVFGPQLAIGATIGCLIINGVATSGVVTLLVGSGGAFDTNQVGGQAIPFSTSKYVMIRLTNITVGSEAYVVYS